MSFNSLGPTAALDAWMREINRICGAFAGRHLSEGFYGQIKSFSSGPLSLSVVQAREVKLWRTFKEIAKDDNDNDNDKYFVVFQLDGKGRLEMGGCASELNRGDMVIIDASSPFSASYEATSRMISVILPRRDVEQRFRNTRVRCGEVISAKSPGVRLALQLIQYAATQPDMDARDGEATLEALLVLLSPAIEVHEEQDSRERLFQKAIAYIDTHIHEVDLCPELIGRQIGVSVRGLYRLFARRGLMVSQHIKCHRLDRCAEILRRAPAGRSLSALSSEWGFGDYSYFSAAFKARFGISPREYRKSYSCSDANHRKTAIKLPIQAG